MLTKELEKQLKYAWSKCWEYHYKILKTGDSSMVRHYNNQYNKFDSRYNSLVKQVEADNKHKVIIDDNKQLTIREVN